VKALTGRAALVTGGGRGIGAAVATALARAGAAVAVAARHMDQVAEVAGTLRQGGFEAYAFRCDVTRVHDVHDVALGAREAMGRVDILVNNAGAATSNPLKRITLDEWNHLIAVNATGTFLCTQALLPGMLERGWGRVVNVASVAGLRGARYIAAYAASKHAVVGFTRSVAKEVDGQGVTVNAVCPGYVDTPLTDEVIERIMARTGATHDEALRTLLEHEGQARLIEASEVAERVVALCLDGSDGVNGEAIAMDGRSEAT
jgi:NAD(P)-dependent dehydrogenase (short-subunit alcohol dehydrogenase family)